MTVNVLNTGKWSPAQAIIEAQNRQGEMEHVVVIWTRKGDVNTAPYLTCSTMRPVDMNFLGFALQQNAHEHMKE